MKMKREIPGPGNYNTLDDSMRKSVPNVKIGTESRDNSLEKSLPNIGPGAYELPSFIGREGIKASISPKVSDKYMERESRNRPGPG